jgi:hypothetical protein
VNDDGMEVLAEVFLVPGVNVVVLRDPNTSARAAGNANARACVVVAISSLLRYQSFVSTFTFYVEV